MKASAKWLGDYVNLLLPLRDLADRLTMAGFEVDSIESTAGSWNNIIVGQLIAVEPHPNADRLRLATVDLGSQQETVVCGAPNLNIGDKVPFAQVGAKLYDSEAGEIVELKPAKIRGVSSQGMVCAEDELGISDNHEGIMVLSPDAPVGIPLADYLGDSILDLSITSNRADCLSIIGIAREIASLTRQKTSLPTITYQESDLDITSKVSVEIEDPHLCGRYCASLIEDVTIGPSPFWMQERLLACGMRPINNIVDITNFVMLEYGQPLHAFDYTALREGKIIVRRAKEGEVMTSLDNVDRTLNPEMLVIADAKVPVAIAGVMGGLDTEVIDVTRTILLESANFKSSSIRNTASVLRLGSEASNRFEKALSPELTVPALKRATQLMADLTGGKPAKGIIDVYPGKTTKSPITISASEIKRTLGIEWGINLAEEVLNSLEFECERKSDSELTVLTPWWRTDIYQSADLVEEVARIIGYDQIPLTMLASPLPSQQPNLSLSLRERVRDLMVRSGFQELISYTLTSKERTYDMAAVHVANPMSSEQEYLRTSLLPGLLTTLSRNQRHDGKGLRIFEIGKTYTPQENDLPQEHETVVGIVSGPRIQPSWVSEKGNMGFYDAKGAVQSLLEALELEADFEPATARFLHPGRASNIKVRNEPIGVVGELHPKMAKDFDLLQNPVCVVELDLDRLVHHASSTKKEYHPVPRFPSSVRDLALVVDTDVPARKVQDIICGFPLVSNTSLFDVYEGKQVPEGKKSLAFRVVFQASDRTLTDEDISKIEQEILAKLIQETGATLRE